MGKGSRNRAARRAAGEWVAGDADDLPVRCARCATGYLSGVTIKPLLNHVLGQVTVEVENRLRPCPSCGQYNVPVGERETRWDVVR